MFTLVSSQKSLPPNISAWSVAGELLRYLISSRQQWILTKMNPERIFARQALTLVKMVTKAKLFQVNHEPIPSLSSFVIIKKLKLEIKKTKPNYVTNV